MRRFRPNVTFGGSAAFAEDRWRTLAVVPAGADEVLKSGGAKLEVQDKWGGATRATAITALEADGLEAIIFGALTIGASAGSAAAGLQAHGLPAKLAVGTDW